MVATRIDRPVRAVSSRGRWWRAGLIAGTCTALIVSAAGPAVADTPFYGVSATVAVTGGPTSVAVDSATDTSYVATVVQDSGELVGRMSVIDDATDTVTSTFAVAGLPQGVTVDPTTDTVYVASIGNDGEDFVLAFDGATNTQKAFIDIAQDPSAIVVNPNTHQVYVAEGVEVQVIDGGSNMVTDTIGIGGFDGWATDLAVNTTTDTVYVANAGGANAVSVIDGDTATLSDVISGVGTHPDGIAVDSATNTVYLAARDGGEVTVIDGDSQTVTGSVGVGSAPQGLTVDPGTGTVYVTNTGDDSVSVIDEDSDTVSATVAVGSQPGAVAVDEDAGSAYVTNLADDSVSVISEGSSPGIDGTPPTARQGVRYSYQFQTFGFPSPTVSLSHGNLPPGLSLSHSGVLSGTPTSSGTSSFVVTASNGIDPDASIGVTLTVAPGVRAPRADLSVTLSAPTRVGHGRLLTATVTVTDTGPDPARAVITTLVVPQGLTVTRTGGGTQVRSGLRFVQRGVARGSRRTYVVTLMAARGARGPRQLIAQTGSATADPNRRNNSATATVRVR